MLQMGTASCQDLHKAKYAPTAAGTGLWVNPDSLKVVSLPLQLKWQVPQGGFMWQ